jgi:nucleotide-binding universal stress UspA family protein
MATNVVVPLDGSDYAERAIGPATVLAKRMGGRVGAVHVARDERKSADEYLERIGRSHGIEWLDARVGDDVAAAIREVARDRDALVCMATHGHGRATAVIGSTTEAVLAAADEPVVAVGRGVDTLQVRRLERIVVALDGTEESETASAPAIRWAVDLGLPVVLTTVVGEPMSAHNPDAAPAFGLAKPHEYIEAAVQRHRLEGATITGEVIVDPLSPPSGMRQFLRDLPHSMVVIATSGRKGAQRILRGSVAGAILDSSPVPAMLFEI